jgi:hypothetical protein
MGSWLNPAISVGPVVFLVGLIVAAVCIAIRLSTSGPKRGVSVPRFALSALVVGLVAFVVGSAVGIELFCSGASSGNLCGLGGLFGTGPLLCGVCVGGYAVWWLKRSRNAAERAL